MNKGFSMTKRILIVMSCIVCLILLTQTAAGQVASPTPAPSKTPTPLPTSTESPVTPTETTVPEPEISSSFDAFSQTDLAVLTGNVQRPNGMVWLDNRLYISCTGDWSVYQIEADTGSTELYIFGLRNAHTMYAENDENGELNLWAPDFERGVLVRITRSGFNTITAQLNGPWGIAYFDDGAFLVTNLLEDNIVLVTRDGQVSEFLTDLRSPTGIVVNQNYVYVANNGSARRGIEWTTAADDTNVAQPAQTLITGLQNTTNLIMGSDGYLYFTYALGTRGVVGRINPELCRESGGCTNDQVEIVVYSDLAAPLAGLAITPDLQLFVHTIYRPELYWVQLDQRP